MIETSSKRMSAPALGPLMNQETEVAPSSGTKRVQYSLNALGTHSFCIMFEKERKLFTPLKTVVKMVSSGHAKSEPGGASTEQE